MELTVIAHRNGEQYLVDLGNGQGRVFDVAKNQLFDAARLRDILGRGFWDPTATSLVETGVTQAISSLLPAAETPVEEVELRAAAPAAITELGPGEFELTLLDEEVPTIDGRRFKPNSITWREMPMPLMFTIENTHEGHKGAIAAGSIKEVWREEMKIKGKGVFDSGAAGQELRRMIKEGTLTGVSSDVGGATQSEELAEDGSKQTVYSTGKIMGATVLPFQAFDDTRIAVTASAATPETPPRAWFNDPELSAPTPLQVTLDGRVFGHVAEWGVCHVGQPGRCTTAPHSKTDYGYFTKPGAVYCDDGTAVATGPITLATGHAPLTLSSRPAAEHYDNTGSAVADVTLGEDAHGIWAAGALRPGLDEARVRELRASKVSGDWRPTRDGLELVAVLAVNSPGFPIRPTARFANGQQLALVAAGVLGQESDMEEPLIIDGDEEDIVAELADGDDVIELTADEEAYFAERLDAIEQSMFALTASITSERAASFITN